MGERTLVGSELGEQRPHLGTAQPAQRGLGPVDVGQSLLEGLQPGADMAGYGVGQQLPELLVQVAAAARPASSRSPVPQAGQVFHSVPGAAQLPHSGLVPCAGADPPGPSASRAWRP